MLPTRFCGYSVEMDEGKVVRRTRYLGLSLEQDTANVPHDRQFHIVHDGKVIKSGKNLDIVQAHYEVIEEELQVSNPELVDKAAAIQARERATRDYAGIRAGTVSRTRAKSNETGGKGGRGGV